MSLAKLFILVTWRYLWITVICRNVLPDDVATS